MQGSPDMALTPVFSPRRLQFRIVALFLGLLLAVQIASLLLIGNSISNNAQAAVNNELQNGERLFARLMQQNAQSMSEAASVLASDYGLRSAIGSDDRATLADALANHGRRIGANLVLYTNASFELKVSTRAGAERFLPLIRRLADSVDDHSAQQVALLDGKPYQIVAVPVKAPVTIGWIAMGFRIDDALLRDMRQLSSIEVALLSRHGEQPWQILQTTLAQDTAAALPALWRNGADASGSANRVIDLPSTSGSSLGGRVLAREVALAGEGDERAVAVLMRSLDEATAPYQRLRWILLAFTMVAIAVFSVGSVLTARRITTPLRALTRSARKLGQGDYDAALDVKAQDEIGELAQAFEAMRRAVRERESEVRRLAYRDSLTALPNREQFRADLRDALARACAQGEPAAVLMLDLDRFKHVNDVLGHRFGDRLLVQVALRLTAEARRSNDVVARLGGDEFAVLLPGADADMAQAVAQRILRSFEQPITLDDHTVDLGAGIGVACCPEHGRDADELVSRAEVAMYAAKRGQLGVVVYDAGLDSSSEESLSMLSELRTAVDEVQLRLFLQPKISLVSGEVVGAEALVRWQHPTRGLIPPMRFIPFAEQTGFIRVLTGWVIERSASVLRQLAERGASLKLSVNLSTRDLLDQDLPAKLAELTVTHAIDPSTLCLEITESAIMDDPQRALQTLERLHGMGFGLAIDDFGTGYSSLAYLKRLPVDELKIDKSFVLNMELDVDDAKIVRSTIDLAHNLGLNVVAEGVETAKTWKILQALGCDEAQGYFMAKPMPEALFAAWLQEWSAPQTQTVSIDTAYAQLL